MEPQRHIEQIEIHTQGNLCDLPNVFPLKYICGILKTKVNKCI
jgi:hypothetical protein